LLIQKFHKKKIQFYCLKNIENKMAKIETKKKWKPFFIKNSFIVFLLDFVA